MKELSIICFLFIKIMTLSLAQKIPNIGYMAYGYDIYKGNPLTTTASIDPGIVISSIFSLSYQLNLTTGDGLYLLPDSLEAIKTTACSYESVTSTIYGQNSYTSSLEYSVSEEAYIDVFAFSASFDYQRVSEAIFEEEKIYVYSQYKCLIWTISAKKYIPYTFSTSFTNAINTLFYSDNNDYELYFDFFGSFGTHYFTEMVLGSSVMMESEFDYTSFNDLENSDVSISDSSMYYLFDSLDVSLSYEYNSSELFTAYRSDYKIITLGASLTDLDSWYSSSEESPQPLKYTIAPIYDLLTSNNFPDISSSRLNTVKTSMEAYLKRYCQKAGGGEYCLRYEEWEIPSYSNKTKTGSGLMVAQYFALQERL